MDTSKVLLWNVPEIQSRPSLFSGLLKSQRSVSPASSSTLHISLVHGSGGGKRWGFLNCLHGLDRSLTADTNGWSWIDSLDLVDLNILWNGNSVAVLVGNSFAGNLLLDDTWRSLPWAGILWGGNTLEAGIPYLGIPSDGFGILCFGIPEKNIGSNEPTQHLPSSARLQSNWEIYPHRQSITLPVILIWAFNSDKRQNFPPKLQHPSHFYVEEFSTLWMPLYKVDILKYLF